MPYFFVYDDCDNPCKPTITLGYNTESEVRSQIKQGFASDEAEARWNYAFWLQNDFFTYGTKETAQAVKNWVISNGFSYYDDNSERDNDPIENGSKNIVR